MSDELLPPAGNGLPEREPALDDQLYQTAKGLIARASWRPSEITKIRGIIPPVLSLTEKELMEACQRQVTTNALLPQVEVIFDRMAGRLRASDFKDLPPFAFLLFSRAPGLIREFAYPEREYLAAIAFVSTKQMALQFTNPEQERNRISWHKHALYFGTLHELLIGTQTNVTFFLKHPYDFKLEFLEKSQIMMFDSAPDEKSFQRKRAAFLFDNYRITPLRNGFLVEIELPQIPQE